MPGRVSPARQRILDKRNQRIWDMYHDEENPKSLSEIAREMERESNPMTKQNVRAIILKMKAKQEAGIDN